eukprot:TRINITY_DN14304_c0_g1_i1.p1 TRINITY_DN14304_c0_g1~~TRINITY_DN14304_c0_g1_i1.p1  ORF type:complete len:314 (+),score=-52.87 TRINITY_DN14304_c0_g1_i1:157-1098(+)
MLKVNRVFVVLGICLISVVKLHSQIRLHTVLPSKTDSSIDIVTSAGDEHYVYLSDSVLKLNKLFLFLPGTLGRGKNPRLIVPFAAKLGYHAISLSYASDIALAQLCKTSDEKKCFENGREEIISGKDLDKTLVVNPANSIENRVLKLIKYLSQDFPTENWAQFLTADGKINWSKICVAGQSQGGGHAAFIAYKQPVDRVVMFASPKDYSDYSNQPANWLFQNSKTSISRFFAFVHSDDNSNGCTWEQQKEIVKLMGMNKFGDWGNVDLVHSPYNHTHLLTSTKKQPFPHGSVINDLSYESAWRYMLLYTIIKD